MSVEELDKKEETTNKPWQFQPGQSGNPAGRPKGSFSIKSKVIKYLEEHPEEFEKLIQFYINDKKMRDLLWRMIDGNPKSESEVELRMPAPILGNVSSNDSNQESDSSEEKD